MKPSHYRTPRTMEEATFQPWGQAIHGNPTRPFDKEDVTVMWACAIITVVLPILLWLTGGL